MKSTVVRCLAAAFIIAGIGACDTAPAPPGIDHEQIRTHIETVTVEPMAQKAPDGGDQFLMRVVMTPSADIRLPDAINILPRTADTPVSRIADDGIGLDRVAGDGVFTGVIPFGCLPGPRGDGSARKQADTGCDLEIVGPGEECGKFGKCPDKAHRSFLWGLIQYDTEVVLCFCLTNCEIKF